jgi:iron complex outermembrane receptor protein
MELLCTHFLLAALALAPAPPDTPVVTLDEVVVIGSRIPEELLRVPAGLSVVDRSDFADTRFLSLKDALGSVPGVFIQSRSGAQDVRLTIRGFGARGNGERSNTGNIRSIRVLTDGIPVSEPDGRTSLDLVDLGSTGMIEVARSNVSAVYGNASGGAVNMRTDLSFESPFAEVIGRAGSFGYHREQGRAGFTFDNGGRATVSIVNSTFDGWRDHSESSIFSGQLRVTAPLSGESRLGVLLDGASDLNRFPGPLTAAQADSAPHQANPTFVARDDRRVNRIGRLALTFNDAVAPTQDLALTFFLEPKVLQRSERNRFRDFNRYHVGGSGTWDWRTSLRSGLDSRLSLGGDEAWQDGSILFYNLEPGGSRGEELLANQREGANSAGVFVQEELIWNEHWSARFGARYDMLWYLAEDHIDPLLNDDRRFSRITPKAALSRQLGRHTIYAALGGGVEMPAFNEIDPPAPYDTLTALNPFLDPMHSTTYELGARGELRPGGAGGGGRVRYDAALYWIDIYNDIVPFDGGAYYMTAGKSRRRGAELSFDWLPIDRLRLDGAFTLSENRYITYENDLGNFSGHQVAGLPAGVLRASARYLTAMGVSGELAVESVDDYFADDANTAIADAYTTLDATVSYARAIRTNTFRLYIAGHNLTDRQYIASVFLNGLNGEFYEPGLPRNWSAGLTFHWE